MLSQSEEKSLRLLIRESLVQESVFDSVFQHLRQRFGGKYDTALNAINISRFPDPSKLAALRDQDIEYILNPMADSWFGKLGTVFGYDINFHRMLDGKNNYRAAISPEFARPSVEFFRRLNRDYGIERVITLNADGGGADIPAMVTAAGLESIYVPIDENKQPTREQFDKIVEGLLDEDALIHCTNGADRTGAVVARYYIEQLGWGSVQAMTDARLYGFRERLDDLAGFLKGTPAQVSPAVAAVAPATQAAVASSPTRPAEKQPVKSSRSSTTASPKPEVVPQAPMPAAPPGQILKYNSNADELAPAADVVNNFSRYGFQTPGFEGRFHLTPIKRYCPPKTKCNPYRKHLGIDYNRGAGDDDLGASIVAPLDGVVKTNQVQGGHGHHLVIDHGSRGYTLYSHLKTRAIVNVGESVEAGQRLGFVGTSGRSSSPHLHFEVKDPAENHIDPDSWLKSTAIYFPVAIKDGT